MTVKENSVGNITDLYRPQKLEEIVGRDEIVGTIKLFFETGEIPNMLFYGTQGTGKTLIAELMIKEYVNKNSKIPIVFRNDASKNNKVEYVRENILSVVFYDGIKDYDIKDIKNPKEIGFYKKFPPSRNIVKYGNYLFADNYGRGFDVFKIEN